MKKNDIRNCAINGLSLEGKDVARVARDGRTVTLRHRWDDEDGRAISAVMSAVRDLARECARRCGRDVWILGRDGSTLDVVYAS